MGYSPWSRQESDMTKQPIFTFHLRISPTQGLTSLLANWITDIKVFYFSELLFLH